MEVNYQKHGYRDRNSYLLALSQDYGIDLETVRALAHLLGESEDFDGLINALEDYDEEYYF